MSENSESVDLIPLDEIPTVRFSQLGDVDVYIADSDEVLQSIEAAGLTHYYFLGIEKTTEVVDNTSVTSRNPQVFEVSSSIIYRAVRPVDNKELGLVERVSNAYFTLPKIPFVMVQKLDTFFRAVDDKLKTEAIVLLTYDESIGGQDGWGFVVPEQENSGAHCDYKPESVAGLYPETANIVGSVHSHPGMAAYASGTDHKDQADFDGLHITYGWTTGPTEYHVEMQIGDSNYIFNPDVVLDKPSPFAVTEEISEMVDKVKKKVHTTSSGYASGYSQSTGPKSTSTSIPSRSNKLEPVVGLPASAESPDRVTYIGRLKDAEETQCPFCRVPLTNFDRKWRFCMACHNFLALPGETLSAVVQVREDQGLMTWDIDVNERPEKPIVVWQRDESDSSMVTVYEPVASGKS